MAMRNDGYLDRKQVDRDGSNSSNVNSRAGADKRNYPPDKPDDPLDPILGRGVEHTGPVFRLQRKIHSIRSNLVRRLVRAPNWRDGVHRKSPASA